MVVSILKATVKLQSPNQELEITPVRSPSSSQAVKGKSDGFPPPTPRSQRRHGNGTEPVNFLLPISLSFPRSVFWSFYCEKWEIRPSAFPHRDFSLLYCDGEEIAAGLDSESPNLDPLILDTATEWDLRTKLGCLLKSSSELISWSGGRKSGIRTVRRKRRLGLWSPEVEDGGWTARGGRGCAWRGWAGQARQGVARLHSSGRCLPRRYGSAACSPRPLATEPSTATTARPTSLLDSRLEEPSSVSNSSPCFFAVSWFSSRLDYEVLIWDVFCFMIVPFNWITLIQSELRSVATLSMVFQYQGINFFLFTLKNRLVSIPSDVP